MRPFKNTKDYKTQRGDAYPLGSSCVAGGVNFALFSAHAKKVELCIFDELGRVELARLQMEGCTNDVWHLHVEGLGEGVIYGYRVYGPYDPAHGHRFNPNKVLLDPYAKKVEGAFHWSNSIYGYSPGHALEDLYKDAIDNALDVPKAVVVSDESFALPANEVEPSANKPKIPWHETVIYETHVRGFTQLNLKVPAPERGTYAGLRHPDVIAYLKDLGVTSVELLPVQGFIDESFLVKQNLTNYWGYNSLHFFAPHQDYSASGDLLEFKRMVSAFHEAGLEVILDVVYNHTAEGNHLGPTLSFRGIDNASYYVLQNHDKRYYANDTGCGNTLNVKHPRVLQMVMDSLRFWANTMGVDGFRFDLATVMGREVQGFDGGSGFFDAVRQDPILARCKLIAEPWDIGPGGYQLGSFPNGWSEWNDRFRDTCRRFWRGEPGVLPEFARRLHGSSDLFEHSGRAPSSSINFITSHDGFTMRDLVSYRDKHNEANNEQNRDGHHANFSENHGVEGETDDPKIEELRLRQQRNLLTTLFLSQGTPMLLAGDELGRSQGGNNNAYCQDNEINWLNWPQLSESQLQLKSFAKYVLELRRTYPLLTSLRYIHKPDEPDDGIKCMVRWLNPTGEEMRDSHWVEQYVQSLGWILEHYPTAQEVEDGARQDKFYRPVRKLILFNAGMETIPFSMPTASKTDAEAPLAASWNCVLDTYYSDGKPREANVSTDAVVKLHGKSIRMFIANFSQ